METDWAIEIERHVRALVATYGDRALTAALVGFCFLLGAALAVGALAACRRALQLWRGRRLWKEIEDSVIVDSSFAVAVGAPAGPPPLPPRWLN